MTTRLVAAAAAVLLGLAVPVSSASAYSYPTPADGFGPSAPGVSPYGAPYAGSVDPRAAYPFCASSASEGNANQQTRSVPQYGQTSGGNRC